MDGPPVWAPVAFCEAMHARWGARIVALLEAERPRWFANCGEAEAEAGGDGGEERPGAAAARVASAALAAEGAGIVVSAAHPCKSRWEPWEVTGPRFYASIIEAALRPMPAVLTTGRPACTGALGGHGSAPLVEHSCGSGIAEGGALPPPPQQLRALLWAASEADAAAPRLTELGWTLVPPHSDPQALHADIASSPDAPDGHPRAGVGRFHHLLWKPPLPQPPPAQPPAPQPSPVIVAGAGAVEAAQVAAPCTTEVCTCTPPPYQARAPHAPPSAESVYSPHHSPHYSPHYSPHGAPPLCTRRRMRAFCPCSCGCACLGGAGRVHQRRGAARALRGARVRGRACYRSRQRVLAPRRRPALWQTLAANLGGEPAARRIGQLTLPPAPEAPEQAQGGLQASASRSALASLFRLANHANPTRVRPHRRHSALRRVDGDVHAAARQHARLGRAGSRRAVRAGPAGAHHTRDELRVPISATLTSNVPTREPRRVVFGISVLAKVVY